MEIRPGLHRIPAPIGERFIAMYLLEGPAGALLFDTGVDDSVGGTLLPYLESIDFSLDTLKWAITSHCDFDHTGGSAALRAVAPHVELMAGTADVAMTEDLEHLINGRYGEFRDADGFDDPPELTASIREITRLDHVDRALTGGEEFDLGDRVIRVLHTPGHSPGHLSVWDEANSALVIGDATLGETVLFANGSPAFPPTYRDTDPYLASIAAFRTYDADLFLTAHYPVYEGAGVEGFLKESEDYVATLDAAILAALSSSEPLSSLELIHAIAPSVGPWGYRTAEYLIFPVTGNLERLVAQGRVTVGDRDGRRTWSAA